ncbi:MAG: hypothetical protein Q9192_007028 [Flavoplaca navasiana]
MHFTRTVAAVAATFAISALAMPTSLRSIGASLLPRGAEGEPFECPSGTAAAKQTLLDAGAKPMDIAIAMLENGCAFTAAYTIGGKDKVDDSAEIGVYRNNWHMLRDHCDHFAGAGPSEWKSRGQELQYVPSYPPLNPHEAHFTLTATTSFSPPNASASCGPSWENPHTLDCKGKLVP